MPELVHRLLLHPRFELTPKLRVVFDQRVDQVFVFPNRDELKGGHAVDGDDHRLAPAERPVAAQIGLGFTQRHDFHDDV